MDRFKRINPFLFPSFILIVVSILVTAAECTCDQEDEGHHRGKTMRYKIKTVLSIFISHSIGGVYCWVQEQYCVESKNNSFFIVKAFAASVILATGVHSRVTGCFWEPDLTSLEGYMGNSSFTGFVAMCTIMGGRICNVLDFLWWSSAVFS